MDSLKRSASQVAISNINSALLKTNPDRDQLAAKQIDSFHGDAKGDARIGSTQRLFTHALRVPRNPPTVRANVTQALSDSLAAHSRHFTRALAMAQQWSMWDGTSPALQDRLMDPRQPEEAAILADFSGLQPAMRIALMLAQRFTEAEFDKLETEGGGRVLEVRQLVVRTVYQGCIPRSESVEATCDFSTAANYLRNVLRDQSRIEFSWPDAYPWEKEIWLRWANETFGEAEMARANAFLSTALGEKLLVVAHDGEAKIRGDWAWAISMRRFDALRAAGLI